jgi:hypothetical protein
MTTKTMIATLVGLALLASPAAAYQVNSSRTVQVSVFTDAGGVGQSRPVFGHVVQIGTLRDNDDSGRRECVVSYGSEGGFIVVERAPGGDRSRKFHGLDRASATRVDCASESPVGVAPPHRHRPAVAAAVPRVFLQCYARARPTARTRAQGAQ